MVTQILGVLAALHGLGNHIEVVLEKGEGQNFLKFAWLTMFFFLIAIATGKAAVAMFLMEINGQVCKSLPVARPHRCRSCHLRHERRSPCATSSHRSLHLEFCRGHTGCNLLATAV